MRLLLVILISAASWAGTPPGRSDHAIEEDIRARFAKSKIASNGFQVRVEGGVATLSGKTDVIQHKGVATRMAKSAGAASVVNNIQIGQKAREKAAARLESARRPAAKAAAPTVPPTTEPSADAPPPVRRAKIKH